MTNFENLKQMDVNELAKNLYNICDTICFASCKKSTGNKFQCPVQHPTKKNCTQCAVKYLKSEVADNDR